MVEIDREHIKIGVVRVYPLLLTVFVNFVFTDDFCTKDSCPKNSYNEELNTISLRDVVNIKISYTLKDNIPNILESKGDGLFFEWPRYGKLKVSEKTIGSCNCHVISWQPTSKDFYPYDCIDLSGAFWFGGSTLHFQRWPYSDNYFDLQDFVTEDVVVRTKTYGNILEPFWVNSKGVGVFVDPTTPLQVSFNHSNSNKICFQAKYTDVYPGSTHEQLPHLKYTVCKGENILSVFTSLQPKIMAKPESIPSIRMMKSPIWSTWARYKININQEKVLKYADEILAHGFSNSQIEIDDMYTTTYGDLDFNPLKFQDPKSMVQELRDKGFRTTAWVTPFTNLDSKAFFEGTSNNYLLLDASGNVPALVKWWQGIGGIIDPTNPNAVSWYNDRLDKMKKEYGLDSFKFDAGERTFLPIPFKSYEPMANANVYATRYVDMVSYHGDSIEVRVGYKTQRHPVFVRMADKESRWGYDNGLKTIIPTALTMGFLGYPYILPDMIGGNGYGEVLVKDIVLPNRELYIRWLEVTAFLPAMQFSFAPWDYDDEVVQIAKEFVHIHEAIVTPILVKATKETTENGSPLIRPMWWIDPEDPTTFTIDSQFMVSDELMVAPILDQGKIQRDIYLPKGKWRDNLNNVEIDGNQWLNDFKVELHQVATFNYIK